MPVTPLLGASGPSGGVSLVPDYILFVALFAVTVHTLRSGRGVEPTPAAVTLAGAA